ncbi:glycoside hydrolase family 2 protein [Phanerochaete carnosa HHB-10118-sp]|uniref:Beta-mannosidase A n=1 Tax=Phanerochaete carnosa (strain HHB-10118-sp) TaxID=650164 RepID=K5W7F1_PHACS|nr:glycoside hydrolase family 2 protein [Phanerochaete carnosa HHB-10118-sp]EKM54884.1 glycoside hydrolase family 2 protein [Phanerochaete carnosa HHB-10118-sp]
MLMLVVPTLCACLALVLPLVAQAKVLSLSDLTWTLKNQNGSIVVPAQVPSQAHLDLLRAEIITEPLLGINEFTQRWIVNDNWTYTADITAFLNGTDASEKALLVFYGLDTVANITVAGHPVAWVNNQFRQYVYDVTDLLASPSSQDTNLTVAFESAWLYGLNVTSRPDVEWVSGDVFEYPTVRQFTRKIQSDYGWDWGPAFVPTGIFKPAYLVTLPTTTSDLELSPTPEAHPLLVSSSSPVFIEESSLEISKVGQTPIELPDESAPWLVNVTLFVRSAVAIDSPSVVISIPELNVTSSPIPVSAVPADTSEPTRLQASFTVPEGVPERWFPTDLGTPKLYNITTSLHFSVASSSPSVAFTTQTGFRTITLVQAPYSEKDIRERGITPGDQWHFNVNGKAFFSEGTNIIPYDPFYARTTSEKVRWVLESAVLSGQNMLRVWGGGIYQPSDEVTGGYDFYTACDELGIFAWSELIFSDALYPINGFLLESIEPEVRQNVRRINKHPSNVQWAGGNEIEGIVIGINQTQANGTHYLDEFQFMFGEFLHDIVSQETNSVAYTDCSTTGGVLSLDPYVIRYDNKTPGFIYGNSERYNYDASQAFNYSTYPVARFVNEFGFHSQPSFFSYEEVLENPEDFSFNSTVVASRDHHPPAGGLAFPNPNSNQGQAQMTEAVQAWLPTPGTADSNQTFAQWCWSTQVFQAMNMVSEIAWYRRGAGLGENNLGSLVWQLNDIWQGTSWSSIEYSGRWKVLHYSMTGIYTPVIIYPFWTPENQTLEVLVTSDRWEAVDGEVQMTWYDWEGNDLGTRTKSFTVPSLNNSVVLNQSGLEKILPKGKDPEDVFMLLNVTANVEGKTVTSEQVFAPVSLANATLVDPKIHVTRNENLTFTLSARGGVAAWTWLDHPAGTVGYFLDTEKNIPANGFYLIPGIDRTVKFVQNAGLSTVQSPSPEDFVLRSLWNNTHL